MKLFMWKKMLLISLILLAITGSQTIEASLNPILYTENEFVTVTPAQAIVLKVTVIDDDPDIYWIELNSDLIRTGKVISGTIEFSPTLTIGQHIISFYVKDLSQNQAELDVRVTVNEITYTYPTYTTKTTDPAMTTTDGDAGGGSEGFTLITFIVPIFILHINKRRRGKR